MIDHAAGPPRSSLDLRFRVGDMDCSSCVTKIRNHLVSLDGVDEVEGLVLSRMLTVTGDPDRVTSAGIRREVERLGYSAEPVDESTGATPRPDPPSPWRTPAASRAYLSALLILAAGGAWLWTPDPVVFGALWLPVRISEVLLAAAAAVGGWNFFPKGLAAARRLSLDMNFLMTVAIIGAVLLGEFTEAAAIAVLFSLAELLESHSVDRARRAIASLMEVAPEWAVVLSGGTERTVPVSSLVPGDTVVFRPGDRIPTDGTVTEGWSAVDQSSITGESLPVDKQKGDPVYSGTINQEGHVQVRVDKPARDSALAKIVRLVEEAEASKTRSERFVERFARYYTPAVTIAAVLTALVPLLFGGDPTVWITRGLTLLVIACPCALVISTPVAVVSGLTAAARRGVLIKGGAHLEALAEVRTLALDKTGTLTVGHPAVQEVIAADGEAERAVLVAAALERHSRHPIARAIVEEAGRRGLDPDDLQVTGFRSLSGEGVLGTVDGVEHTIGRPALFPGSDPPAELARAGHTVVGVSRGAGVMAWISLADRGRDEAPHVMEALRALGVERLVMLTGDNRATAEAVGAQVGVDEVHAELMPADKLRFIVDLTGEGERVAMVGDGVNDAPALAAASVGIAMGAAGSDTALETADVALMGDDLRGLPYAVGLSKRSRDVIRQNIAAAIGIKFALAVGVPLGFVSLITAVLVGDLGVSIAVTLNALRLAGGPGGGGGGGRRGGTAGVREAGWRDRSRREGLPEAS